MALDSKNMLQAIKDFPKHSREALTLPRGIAVKDEIDHIFVVGMGGSAISGDILKSLFHEIDIPVHVIRDYKMPDFLTEHSLVFAVSYSGNTEETLSAVEHAIEKKPNLIAITSGGKLAGAENVIKIPAGLQPRAALGYLFFPMLGVLHNSNIIRIKNEDLNEMIDILKGVDEINEEAETLAKKIKDKIPIIYASDLLKPVAYRWKTQINENAKQAAFYNVFSEMNHNEIAGIQGMDRKYIAILLRDKFDNKQVQKRMEICKELMEERFDVEEIYTRGNGLLARIFSTIFFGDFVSYHLALWNRVDPTPVDIIEDLKGKLV